MSQVVLIKMKNILLICRIFGWFPYILLPENNDPNKEKSDPAKNRVKNPYANVKSHLGLRIWSIIIVCGFVIICISYIIDYWVNRFEERSSKTTRVSESLCYLLRIVCLNSVVVSQVLRTSSLKNLVNYFRYVFVTKKISDIDSSNYDTIFISTVVLQIVGFIIDICVFIYSMVKAIQLNEEKKEWIYSGLGFIGTSTFSIITCLPIYLLYGFSLYLSRIYDHIIELYFTIPAQEETKLNSLKKSDLYLINSNYLGNRYVFDVSGSENTSPDKTENHKIHLQKCFIDKISNINSNEQLIHILKKEGIEDIGDYVFILHFLQEKINKYFTFPISVLAFDLVLEIVFNIFFYTTSPESYSFYQILQILLFCFPLCLLYILPEQVWVKVSIIMYYIIQNLLSSCFGWKVVAKKFRRLNLNIGNENID